MPLNKLDNFIKNTEGRILYVSPADLDSTDSIDNQGNSLARPFKTIQRAILESARFSYVKGDSNDLVEQTTILLMPGEHVVDNRPGYKIKKNISNIAELVSPNGVNLSVDNLFLSLESNFDLTQEDNILYKFNSVNGGVIVPRGVSIVGLDLRKTKIRPKYVPNPTDPSVNNSAIFRITGGGYYWQFSIFDGDEIGTVYTDPTDFSEVNRSKPIFSHHKLTVFEYADGVNTVSGYDLTDLDMYYAKLSRAYSTSSGRDIDSKYPGNPLGFTKQRPEWEIVGAFSTDDIDISSIISGDGVSTPNNIVTVTTTSDHNLSVGTPIKIRGCLVSTYNISTKVQTVDSNNSKKFTYILPTFPQDLDPNPGLSNAKVTIETDTVTGASPYIFNVSLRSVFGMNGMHADGSKASGFRSMVVAQFTGISLQKDDRAFVKYSKTSRNYEGLSVPVLRGSSLSSGSSSTDLNTAYHLDSGAIYRKGWNTTHIKLSNDAVVQVVSVFAIGYTKHFESLSGGDASITNSNSNFGQLSLISDGFKKEAFEKDDRGYITHIIPPRSITSLEENVEWFTLDITKTKGVGLSNRLYITGFNSKDIKPSALTQGYRVGAKINDKLFVEIGGVEKYADILMSNGISSVKETAISGQPSNNIFTTTTNHNLQNGEKVILISDDGDLPENIDTDTVYFAIVLNNTTFKLAASKSNSDSEEPEAINVYGGTNLRVLSRVSDKESGDVGHPIQFDESNSHWYLQTNASSEIYTAISSLSDLNTDVTYVKRINDTRSLDEKLFKVRVSIPKGISNAKTPESGFIIQESSSTGVRTDSDFVLDDGTYKLKISDYEFNRNPRFIATCSEPSSGKITVISELPHNLQVNDTITIKNAKDSNVNTLGLGNSGLNGTFAVTDITDDLTFKYSTTDVDGVEHSGIGNFTSNVYTTEPRSGGLPRFERTDLKKNLYVYRNEVISEYIEGENDGIYHLYLLNADNRVTEEFDNLNYSQKVVNLYPQLDRDNIDDNPRSSKSFAMRSPLGKVVSNDSKKSITRETIDKLTTSIGFGITISSVSTTDNSSTITFSRPHGIGGVYDGVLDSGNNDYTDGTYYNVKLYNEIGLSNWNGATAKVVVTSGYVASVEIINPGSNYNTIASNSSPNNRLYFDTSIIGSGTGAYYTIDSSRISSGVGDVIQITGAGTTSDGYYTISSVDSTTQISLGRTSSDPTILPNQYGLLIGPSISVDTVAFNSDTGISSISCLSAHGLVAGNSVKIIDSISRNLGEYLVKSTVGIKTFSILTNTTLNSPTKVLKFGYSSNDGVSDKFDENISARGHSIYDNNYATIEFPSTNPTGTGITFAFRLPNSGLSTETKFPYGSYAQVGNEILRVRGFDAGNVEVIRGSLGTKIETISEDALVRRIHPIPVEFHRPSILRASGHTFEYLGYGPGNYSTGLPQLQNKTLSEREEFLVQSQERGGGIVVYTGMNNKGDFFIGNQKKSSATGEETTFDTPIPTITGENPARLSSIFDEVTVKERFVVEGGDSNLILSQFDGPVTFNNETRFKNTSTFTNLLNVSNEVDSTSTTTGAVKVSGGVGIAKTLHANAVVSKKVRIGQVDNTIDSTSGDLIIKSDDANGSVVAIHTNTTISGILSVTGDITAFYTSSDERLKENIVRIDDPLAKVLSISGNTFDWKDYEYYEGKDTGVIAQEIEALNLPGIVKTNSNGYKSVQYHKLIPLLIGAIQELNNKVEVLEQRLNN